MKKYKARFKLAFTDIYIDMFVMAVDAAEAQRKAAEAIKRACALGDNCDAFYRIYKEQA